MRFFRCSMGVVIGLAAILAPRFGWAQAAPGDILITEWAEGTVVNVRGGGDFTGTQRFASGLERPMGICQGPGGEIYVAENDIGAVKIITEGGAMAAAPLFAFGLPFPQGLWCDERRILVTTSDGVFDVAAGGDFADATPFASGLSSATGIWGDTSGTVWASTYFDGVFDITAGGDFSAAAPFAAGGNGLLSVTEHDGELYVIESFDIALRQFTDANGADLSAQPTFATVTGLIGVLTVPELGILALSSGQDAIYDITAGGSFTSKSPKWATGVLIGGAESLAAGVYVAGCGDGLLSGDETCDDANESDTDACPATCRDAVCGDGFVRADVEDCDDGNTTPGDGCSGDCQSEGAGSGGAGSGGAAAGGAPDSGEDPTFTREPSGCSCSARGGRSAMPLLALLGLGLLIRWRRRPARRLGAELAGAVVFACLLTLPLFGHAQTPEQRAAARAAADAGLEAFNQGNYASAVDLFTRAEAVVHAPTHLLYIARASAQLGRFVRAREAYLTILREPVDAGAPKAFRDAHEAARDELPKVESRLGHIDLRIEGADAAQAQVLIDGVAQSVVGVAIPVDPGDHQIQVRAPGRLEVIKAAHVTEGQKIVLTVTLEIDPSPQPTPQQPLPQPEQPKDSGPPWLQIAGGTAIGIGAVGLALGVAFTVKAQGSFSDADALCPAGQCPEARRAEIEQLDSDGETESAVGIAGFVVGGAFAVAGVTMLVIGSTSNGDSARTLPGVRAVAGPTWLGLRGTF
jgi:MYXO-CTERM domain-containing protein